MAAASPTIRTLFWDIRVLLYILTFFSLRAASFFVHGRPIIEGTICFFFLLAFGALYFKDRELAFIALLGELLLGGSGALFEFSGLALRTLLLFVYLSLFFIEHIILPNKRKVFYLPHTITAALGFFILFLVYSISRAFLGGHALVHIYQDTIPFLYFFLIIPGAMYIQERSFREEVIRIIFAFIVSSAIFSIMTFTLFSTGSTLLHGDYYRWFRDTLGGKVTDLGTGFFRIVLPEHLLIVPFLLIINSLLMKDERHHILWRMMLILGLVILTMNLSRTYILAFAVGFLFLGYRHYAHRWITVLLSTLFFGSLTYLTIHLIASAGTSTGVEILLGRFAGIVDPARELSAYTRSTLLTPIFEIISRAPFFGNGLGSTLTFVDPTRGVLTETTQYDWGILELIAEFGLFGMIAYMTFVATILLELIERIRNVPSHADPYIGIIAAIISMVIMTVTAPVLFHVFGVNFLVGAIVIMLAPLTFHERFIHMIYRIFHRLPPK